jgi:hypothetical protein
VLNAASPRDFLKKWNSPHLQSGTTKSPFFHSANIDQVPTLLQAQFMVTADIAANKTDCKTYMLEILHKEEALRPGYSFPIIQFLYSQINIGHLTEISDLFASTTISYSTISL